MKESYVIYNGKIVKEEEVSISIRSKAFNYGLGCFEGIRAYWDEEKKEMLVKVIKEHTGCNEVVFNALELNNGYIDHQSYGETSEAFSSEENLKNFIFNPGSNLHLDNDNH